MEVLRFIAASRQVGEGPTVAGPRQGTRQVAVIELPAGWPEGEDVGDLPEPDRVRAIPGLDPEGEVIVPAANIEIPWGGMDAARRILVGWDGPFEDVEKAVLERIAMADLV